MEISTKALESLIQRAKAKLREKIELKEKKKDTTIVKTSQFLPVEVKKLIKSNLSKLAEMILTVNLESVMLKPLVKHLVQVKTRSIKKT